MDIFTPDDRRRIQVALDLHLDELKERSDLWFRLEALEEFDRVNGTAIAVGVQGYLTAIDEADAAIAQSYTDGSANASATMTRIDEFTESFQYGGRNGSGGSGLVKGLETRKRSLVYRLKRDLGYLKPLSNIIPVM